MYKKLFYGSLHVIVLILMLVIINDIFYDEWKHHGVRFVHSIYFEPIEPLENAQITEKSQKKGTNQNCRFHSCFDLFRCPPNNEWTIKVYIYPYLNFVDNGANILPRLSSEFQMIIKSIRHSKYYTSNATEACIFIPMLDFLLEMQINPELASSILPNLERYSSFRFTRLYI